MTPSKIIELLSFPRETREYLLKRLKMKDIPFLAKNAYICTGLDFPICKYSAADRLSVLVWLLSEKNRDYLALGVPTDVIVNTFVMFPYAHASIEKSIRQSDSRRRTQFGFAILSIPKYFKLEPYNFSHSKWFTWMRKCLESLT